MVAGRMYIVQPPNLSNIFFPNKKYHSWQSGRKISLFVKLYNSLAPSFHIGEKSPFSVETLIPGDLSWLHIVFKVYSPPSYLLPHKM